MVLNNDNTETRRLVEHCYRQAKTSIQPIIDWTDDEVWEFIHTYKIPYCELYDKGFKRCGCIGCPMSTKQRQELDMYPKYKELYLKAFDKMLAENERKGVATKWKNAEEVMEWWLNG